MENQELTITRSFEAPRERVWRAWTDPKQLQRWWGPSGVTCPTCEFQAAPGGAISIVMLAGPALGPLAGAQWPMTGTVIEVVAPERLLYSSNAIVNGQIVLETLTTVSLAEADGRTELTVHIVVTKTTPEAAGPLSGMKMGWTQSIDKLGAFVTTA